MSPATTSRSAFCCTQRKCTMQHVPQQGLTYSKLPALGLPWKCKYSMCWGVSHNANVCSFLRVTTWAQHVFRYKSLHGGRWYVRYILFSSRHILILRNMGSSFWYWYDINMSGTWGINKDFFYYFSSNLAVTFGSDQSIILHFMYVSECFCIKCSSD